MLLVLLGLVGFGLVMIDSAVWAEITGGSLSGTTTSFLIKQGGGAVLGLALLVLIIWFDYTEFVRLEKVLYIAMCVLLIAVHFVGHSALGATRWIQIGGLQIQPSEPAKFLFILTMASFLSRHEGRLKRWWELIPPAIFGGIPFILVATQPDLGSALVFIAILLSMLYMAGASGRKLLFVTVLGLSLVSGLIFVHQKYHVKVPIQEYQIQRITCFLQNTDPSGICYQVTQSKIAIGSGGLFGKGLRNGTQSMLGYLPEQHTDMIFAVVGEESGFVGSVLLIGGFVILLLRMHRTSLMSKDPYGRLIVVGTASMLAFHAVENIGMTMGVMPIAGIPLPFISYGPSALVTNLMACALVFSVGVRQRSINF